MLYKYTKILKYVINEGEDESGAAGSGRTDFFSRPQAAPEEVFFVLLLVAVIIY